ncbi:Outer membrane porin PhoE (plasmid) [Pantoea sp. Nvir]|uniref:porin n=1 Tax=Pantoea sp. Nvir TaxID=2576760 RepID=UPI0030D05458
MRFNLAKVSFFIVCSAVSFSALSAEIYNRDGNKLDFTGKVEAKHLISDNDAVNGDQTIARIGFRGQTQINDKLTGYGQWEYQFGVNKSEGDSDARSGDATRLGFAGLKLADAGSIDYGRGLGVIYDTNAFSDMAPGFGASTMANNDNFMSKRSGGLLTYRSPVWEGLKFNLQYQGKNDRAQATKSNGDGYGASVNYAVTDAISLSAAGSKANRTLTQQADGLGNDASAWITGFKYDANQIYVGAIYGQTKNMTPYGQSQIAGKTRNVEVIAQYQFLNGWRPSVGFVTQRGEGLPGYGSYSGGDQTLQKYAEIGTYYYFNKNMLVWVDYKINLLHENEFTKATGVNTDDIFGVDLVYQF